MIVELVRSAHDALIDMCLEAAARGTETHAYLLGRKTLEEIIITTVLRAGTPVEHAGMTRPDYAASALAMQPYLARGEVLVGEAHRHPTGYRGPSPGDLRMLRNISPEKFPGYLCMVVTDMPDGPPVITAHSIKDGEVVEHEVRVIENAYPVLLPKETSDKTIFAPGAGSGGCLTDLQLAKLPLHGITTADFDRFEERNLHRHIATPEAIGQLKAEYMADFLTPRSTARIASLDLAITPENRDAVDQLVRTHASTVNNTGDPRPSILLSQACARAGKVCVHAGAFPRGSGGFVFLQTPDGPCYECLYDLTRSQNTEDPATLALLAKQYGYSEADLAALIGLWTDVNVVASIQAKVVLEYLKHGNRPNTPNLWVINNDTISITARRVVRHPECTTCQPEEAA